MLGRNHQKVIQLQDRLAYWHLTINRKLTEKNDVANKTERSLKCRMGVGVREEGYTENKNIYHTI